MADFAARINRKTRRKRHPDENESITSPVQQPHNDVSGTMLQLQGVVGNRNLQRMLNSQSSNNTIQRLMTYKTYKKDTSAMGRRNHIRPIDKAFKAYTQEQGGLSAQDKLARLKQLIGLCDVYLADVKRQKSKRRDGVEDLKQELVDEVNAIKVDLNGTDFSEGNVTEKKRDVVGGQMNKLDYIKYNFGVTQDTDDQGNTTDKKVVGGEMEAYFKEQTTDDQMLGNTRGAWTGIDAKNPKYAERSVATYEIAKLLDPAVIPPTFMAKHDRNGKTVDGFVMKIVQGVAGSKQVETDDDKGAAAKVYKNDPVYRESMSKLMLLDFICGQVDRHAGNYIIELGDDGKVKGVMGIDNDLSFGDKFTDTDYGGGGAMGGGMFNNFVSAGGKVTDLNEIDKKFAERIIQLSQNSAKVRAVLTGLLTTSEVDAAISRIASLAQFLQPLLNSNSPRIKTKWE